MKNIDKIPVLAIVGPTATGKTKLAIELAKKFNGEIVCADSMQIYKELNIGTAKPTKEEMGNIRHHLVDFVSLDETFSVARYVKLARQCVEQIYINGKLPIICGGTGLYVKNLLINNSFIDNSLDFKIREELENRVQNHGIEPLLLELKKIDPETVNKLHKNDKKRIIRGLEIYYAKRKTLTDQNEISKKIANIYRSCVIGLGYKDRSKLYGKIDERVDAMVNSGLLEEAKKVIYGQNIKTAKAAIGYKEFMPYFIGKISLKQAIEDLKRETRRYAKRQLTWFRKDDSIFWIYIDECENFREVLRKCENYILESFNI
ncbi:MAG: tRNA (adenosine(37)-N6)-dimethylallyltransferase MiaA [Oscillospiraceae bacterium]|jgi:tRNA dimethylallyltransferase|nr:tRNA (adenosine(37)-N6)-dimethylallyltransferase MiaA [Oscillospiraceae bacterium]